MEMLSVPIIATIVFSLVQLIKVICKNCTKFSAFIPLISGVLGGVLGVVAFFTVPTLIPTANIFHAFIVGLLSGLSATGSHQLVTQIKKQANTDSKK